MLLFPHPPPNLLQNHSTERSFVISGHKTGWRWNSIHLISSNSFGIKRCKGLRKRKRTHQSEVVKLCSGPRVHSRLSDMLNRSTLLCSPLIVSAINLLPVILEKKWKKRRSFLPTLLKTHYLVCSLWKVPQESCTSGSQCQMMSRRALTQSPPHREFLREVGCALFSLPVPPWHLPAIGEPRGAIWRGLGPEHGGLSLTEQVGDGGRSVLRGAQTPSMYL